LAISLVFKRQGIVYLIFQSGTKRNVIVSVPTEGGTNRTEITGAKRTEIDCVPSQKWHKSNRNAWHYNSEKGGTKRTEVSNSKGTDNVLIILENGAKMPADLGGEIYLSFTGNKDFKKIDYTPIEEGLEIFKNKNLNLN
jgi:hypothetical protein